jgi:hypothetical protein
MPFTGGSGDPGKQLTAEKAAASIAPWFVNLMVGGLVLLGVVMLLVIVFDPQAPQSFRILCGVIWGFAILLPIAARLSPAPGISFHENGVLFGHKESKEFIPYEDLELIKVGIYQPSDSAKAGSGMILVLALLTGSGGRAGHSMGRMQESGGLNVKLRGHPVWGWNSLTIDELESVAEHAEKCRNEPVMARYFG